MLSKIKYFFLINALLFGLVTKGQSAFNNYYPSGSLSSAFKVQNTNTSDFLVSSYYKDNITGQQGLDLNLLDNNGTSILHKTFLFGNLDFLSFANNKIQCNISNSTMLLTGGSFSGTASAVIFTSVNKNTLDTNWSKVYVDGIYDYYISHVFKIKPNEIWFMGGRGNSSSSYPFIFKMDTLGNILSVKSFTAMNKYETRQIYYDTASSRFYIGGDNYNNAPVPYTYYVTCIDTTGFIVWNKQVCATQSDMFLYDIKKVGNEVICAGGLDVTNDLQFGEARLNLFKLNATNGNVIWNKMYGKPYMINTLGAILVQADGSIICSGSYCGRDVFLEYHHDACLLKVNSNGDSLWMKAYGNYGQDVQEYIFDLQATPDGGYIMCGAPNSANPTHSWVIKTDSLGIAPGMIDVGINETEIVNTDFTIYPNPVNDLLKIEFINGLTTESKSISIYNNLGQLVKEEEIAFKNKNFSVNTSDLSSGVYLLNIKNKNSASVSKRFVISR